MTLFPTSDIIATFDRVSKVYPNGTCGLRSVTLSIPRGQFCVLLGRSGAGKSTLLRLTNGLVSASDGDVTVDGIRMSPKTRRRLQPSVAMIHQHFNLSPRMSVIHNVLAGSLYDISTVRSLLFLFPKELQRKACRLVNEVGLSEEHLYRRASQLSGGQQQRVGIARAFIRNPKIVLADEPVASLDPRISRDVLSLLRREAREKGATVLCSLHQVDLAREFADRVIGMGGGQVVFDGVPEEIDSAALSRIYDDSHERIEAKVEPTAPSSVIATIVQA